MYSYKEYIVHYAHICAAQEKRSYICHLDFGHPEILNYYMYVVTYVLYMYLYRHVCTYGFRYRHTYIVTYSVHTQQ